MSLPAVEFRTPTAEDIDRLAAEMRDQDVAEMHALGYTDLRSVVQSSVDVSDWCLAVLVKGELAAIFGIGQIGTPDDPIGTPWMLGTPVVARSRRILATLAPQYIRGMLRQFPRLTNIVHARNTVAAAWLARCGFVLQPPQPVGPHGELFHVFEMRASHV